MKKNNLEALQHNLTQLHSQVNMLKQTYEHKIEALTYDKEYLERELKATIFKLEQTEIDTETKNTELQRLNHQLHILESANIKLIKQKEELYSEFNKLEVNNTKLTTRLSEFAVITTTEPNKKDEPEEIGELKVQVKQLAEVLILQDETQLLRSIVSELQSQNEDLKLDLLLEKTKHLKTATSLETSSTVY